MSNTSYFPTGLLSQYISVIWFLDTGTSEHTQERTLPTGTVDLVFNLSEETSQLYTGTHLNKTQSLTGPIVCGAHSRPFGIDTSQPTKVLGIHFKPGGAASFLGLPSNELQNQNVALNDLWGHNANTLLDQLRHQETVYQQFRLLEQILCSCLEISFHADRITKLAIPVMESTQPQIRIRTLADQFGLSQRQFYQIFHEHVGVSPKTFLRIHRFQKALQKLETVNKNPEWAHFAVECGYFDQAHLIKEFVTLSGLTPLQYQAQKGNRLNHIPISA